MAVAPPGVLDNEQLRKLGVDVRTSRNPVRRSFDVSVRLLMPEERFEVSDNIVEDAADAVGMLFDLIFRSKERMEAALLSRLTMETLERGRPLTEEAVEALEDLALRLMAMVDESGLGRRG